MMTTYPEENRRAPGAQITGLSQAEAARRRAAGQGNDVKFQTSRSYAQILRENAFTFINNVLFAIGAVLILMGSIDNAIVTAGLVLLNVVVNVVQEARAKRTLDHIALLTRPRAQVLRDGQEQAVDPAEIVMGDVLILQPGDQVVVDGQVVSGGPMTADESLLTGESDPITKNPGDAVYSGSFCLTGSAWYEAQKVGRESLANQITAQARTFRRTKTPLQHDVDYVIRTMVLLAAQLGLLLALSGLLKHTPLLEWIEVAAVIVVLVPQGLFFMTTLTYAGGAVRMAGKGALVQQANAIESMSNVDVLCLDKTGTLTTNQIRLETIDAVDPNTPLDELRCLLGEFAASQTAGNRTAKAIASACPANAREVAEEVPFSSEWKWSGLRFAGPGLEPVVPVYVLGAPEVLLPCLDDVSALGSLEQSIEAYADTGRRVVLFAAAWATGLVSPPAGGRARPPLLPVNLTPLALLSFSDELRPEAEATLRGFADAGIAVKIISGDSPDTVAALARQAGFGKGASAVSGLDLAAMENQELAEVAENTQVFGRITPQQKEELVTALREQGHYVAMIGDGVNDVLSLKKANLGIAMQAGSQAARSVADIVLLNDSFAALPAAFREGQRILRGMQDVIRLFLARTLTVTLLIVYASIAGTAFPITPKHNAVLALLTVGIPTLALAAWARPGRPTYWSESGRRPSILRSVQHFVLPATFSVAVLAFAVYLGFLLLGRSVHDARTAMTTAMVLCGILLIVFVEPPTAAFAGGDDMSGDLRPTALAGGMLLLYLVILLLPAARGFFNLAPLPWTDLALIGGMVLAWAVVILQVWRHKVFERLLGI
jgi:cation-transporting ATPase E